MIQELHHYYRVDAEIVLRIFMSMNVNLKFLMVHNCTRSPKSVMGHGTIGDSSNVDDQFDPLITAIGCVDRRQ